MTTEEIAALGAAYRRATRHKALVYQLASKVAGRELEVDTYNQAQVAELEELCDLTIGSLLMLGWDVSVPDEILAGAKIIRQFSIPGSLEVH